MAQSAYIKLVQGSAATEVTTPDIRQLLQQYRESAALTGRQLGWDYASAAFPYTIEAGSDDRWFYLKGVTPQYKHIIMGAGETAASDGGGVPCIQVVLPDEATHGDKAKGNELCKYMARKLQGELVMFNGRTVYYNPRK